MGESEDAIESFYRVRASGLDQLFKTITPVIHLILINEFLAKFSNHNITGFILFYFIILLYCFI